MSLEEDIKGRSQVCHSRRERRKIRGGRGEEVGASWAYFRDLSWRDEDSLLEGHSCHNYLAWGLP